MTCNLCFLEVKHKTTLGGLMKKLIQIVRDNCEFTKEEIEQEKLVTGLSNAFVETLIQKTRSQSLLISW